MYAQGSRPPWKLSAAAFERLLQALDADRDRAAVAYEQLRLRIIGLLRWWGAAEADALFREAIERYLRQLPPGHITIGRVKASYARFLLRAGRAAEAEPPARDAQEIRGKALPAGHWLRGQIDATLGAILATRGHASEGLLLMRHDLGLLQAALPPGDARSVEVQEWLLRHGG